MNWDDITLPDYAAEDISPAAKFQRNAIRTFHKVVCPTVSFDTVLREFFEQFGHKRITWDWYSEQLVCSKPLPDLTFARDVTLWDSNLHDLLQNKTSKLKVYGLWGMQPSDGLVFPLVGAIGIIHRPDKVPSREGILKEDKKGMVFIELLKSYASQFEVTGLVFIQKGLT